MNSNKSTKIIKFIILLILLTLFIYWFIEHTAKPKPTVTPPTVIVKKPSMTKMGSYIIQTGNTVAFNSVNLVARIEGYLQEIDFVDGSFVKKGKNLFVIEPQPYLDKVQEAQANLAAQKANYAYRNAEYGRQQQMYKENATSLKNVEKWAAQLDEAKAGISRAQAKLNNAEINYSYTHVLAPFDGRIGRHLVDVGNLVGHGEATQLATIEQIDPIYVYINLNELALIKLRKAAHARGIHANNINTIPVFVGLQTDTDFPYEGKLDFVNTGLNASTGTMQFRAILPNKDHSLLPGLFVQVKVPLSEPVMQLTVPETAVQYDQLGAYILVLGKDNYIEARHVVLGSVEDGKQVISKGLNIDEQIVINGLQNAMPGQQVTPKIAP
ncbi:efflux RND transporter periplasmic adaptor subunit [Legionella sp. D16C41]|uniref:efflux RND transporter periplasmic adaptor subunit n=1 Tax=Legionella sp. D16C41 TaxID=3402688 RepID=UPI003AF99C1B